MREKAVSRPWSRAEDDLLRQAVDKHGTQDNWKAVALEVPGRNNKACRKRWLHSLSPSIKKSAWTTDEDQLLLKLYNTHGPKWSFIARQIEGRTDDACSKRYNEALDPSLNKAEWTAEEDEKLIQAYAEVGGKWKDIGQRLHRSGLGCRNRWKLLERKGTILRTDSPSRTGEDIALPRTSFSFSTDSLFPYYPPESYHLFPQDPSNASSFREPTPEIPAALPTPPPFQFSSSSLSAALFDPPRLSRYSTYVEGPPTDLSLGHSHTPLSSSSPSPSSYASQLTDDLMSLDDNSLIDSSVRERDDIPTLYSFDGRALVSHEFSICPAGPSRIEQSSSSQGEAYKSPHIDTMEDLQYPHNHLTESPFSVTSSDIVLEDLSTAPPSPSGQPASISSTSSPNAGSPVELNSSEQSLPDSLLFSSTPPSSNTRRDSTVISRKHALPPGHARLSSVMPLSTDQSIRPYACGHSLCWPRSADTSSACFTTSRELFEHCKLHSEFDDERPYRCALPHCGKSWKSLNGLQYHLQLSTAHFQQAMSEQFLSQSGFVEVPETESSDKELKRYVCDQPNCFKTYKNSSGLRYHKKHGHPKKMPLQLSDVPPALARDLQSRTKKMRQKDAEEQVT